MELATAKRGEVPSLPPDDKREEWIRCNAAKLRQLLADSTVQREVLSLLIGERLGDDDVSD
jgi:hypothetical protein